MWRGFEFCNSLLRIVTFHMLTTLNIMCLKFDPLHVCISICTRETVLRRTRLESRDNIYVYLLYARIN